MASKMYEVTKFFTRTEHIHGVCAIIMNGKKFDSLPADLQKALEESAKETCKYILDIAPQKEEEGLKVLRDKGMVINTFDKAPAIVRQAAFGR